MNNSGRVFGKDKIDTKKIIIIHDDIDLPFGKIKLSFGRGDGGHNGLKDIIKVLGTKRFVRIRVGVCPVDFFGRCRKPKGGALNKYLVEKRLSKKYILRYEELAEKVEKILKKIIFEGVDVAMNEFNKK